MRSRLIVLTRQWNHEELGLGGLEDCTGAGCPTEVGVAAGLDFLMQNVSLLLRKVVRYSELATEALGNSYSVHTDAEIAK